MMLQLCASVGVKGVLLCIGSSHTAVDIIDRCRLVASDVQKCLSGASDIMLANVNTHTAPLITEVLLGRACTNPCSSLTFAHSENK